MFTLLAPRVVAVRKRARDYFDFFVFVSRNEHGPLTPTLTSSVRAQTKVTGVQSAVQKYGERVHLHLCPNVELLVNKSEIQSEAL